MGDNLSFYRGLKGWGWDGRGYPTVPLCGGGRYTLLLEASEGVLDYLRMCACLSGEYDYRTLPLQAPSDYFPQYSWRYDCYRIIPLEYTAAGENAAFGPEGEWSNQRWLEIRDV